MPATAEVKVIIGAKDNASKVLRGLSKEFNQLSKSSEHVIKDFKALGKIALGAGVGILALATKAAFSAARVEELTFALHAIAKANDISSQAADEAVKSLRDMNIAHGKALQVTSLFIQSQLDLADATKVANAAKDLAVIAGLDSSEATETLTRAIVMQRPMLLKQFGIVKGLDKIYDDYRKTTGKTAKELTELEKRQAFLNAILGAGEKVAGTYEAAMGSVSKQFRSLTGRIIPDFMAKIGKAFSPALTAAVDAITKAIKNMSDWMDQNADTITVWGEKLGRAAAKGIEIFSKLVKFVMNNKEILVGVFAVLAVGVGALAAAFVVAHAAAIAAIAKIIVIVTLLAKAWNTNFLGIQTITRAFVDNLKRLFETIKNTFETTMEALQRFRQFWTNLTSAVVNAMQTIESAVKGTYERIREWLVDKWNTVVKTFISNTEWLVDVLKVVWEKMVEITRKNFSIMSMMVVGWIETLPNQVEGATRTMMRLMGRRMKEGFLSILGTTSQFGLEFLHTLLYAFGAVLAGIAVAAGGWPALLQIILANLLMITYWSLERILDAFVDSFKERIPLVISTGLELVKSIFSGNLDLILQNFKSFVRAVLDALADFGYTAIGLIDFMLNRWLDWFKMWGIKLLELVKSTLGKVLSIFGVDLNSILDKWIAWISNLRIYFNKGAMKIIELVQNLISRIKDLINQFKPRIKIELDLPDIGAAWENLKQRARDIGVPGFQTGGIVSGPIGAPTLATVHGGERVIPAGVAPATVAAGGGLTINAYIGLYAGSETEKRNIASELYTALARLARSQNKTISELIGA